MTAILYGQFKHTFGCQVSFDGQTDDDWYDLDVYATTDDPREALKSYLDDEYDDNEEAIKEESDGTFSVVDPDDPSGKLVRKYRIV